MTSKPRVLVVDDDPDIALLMQDFLEADGFAVTVAQDGRAALTALASEPIVCVVLDVMMPGLSGFGVIREIRETSDVPVLFLSAKQDDSDKIRGLGLGADDYIVKSATPAEVVARVKAVLRRVRPEAGAESARMTFGRVVIDADAREIWVAGEPVSLTAREYDLLLLLATHPRKVLTRDMLFERLWGPYGDRHSLTVHIGRLRDKLEADPSNPTLIVTVWGVGYRFEPEPAS